MASPSPSPPSERVVDESAWRKRSKMCGRNAGSIPRPLSVTSIWACESVTLDVHRRPDRPEGVNFTAFESRFQTTCCKPGGVPRHGPERRASAELELDALRIRRVAHTLQGRVDHVAEIRDPDLQAELSRDDARTRRADPRSASPGVACCARSASSARLRAASSMRPERSSATQVRITLSGERSSCESVARNSSLVRLAASALSRAACSRASASRMASSARRARSKRPHRRHQDRGFDRLGERGVGTALERAHRVLLAHVRGRDLEDDHGRRRRIRLETAAHLETVDARQVHVEKDQPRSALGNEPQRIVAARRLDRPRSRRRAGRASSRSARPRCRRRPGRGCCLRRASDYATPADATHRRIHGGQHALA